MYNAHIDNSFLVKIKLVNLRKENFQIFFNSKLKEELSISTIKKVKVFINTILNYAEKEDYINKNYSKNVKLPTIPKQEKHKFLSYSNGKINVTTPKTSTSIRTIYFNEQLANAIKNIF